MTIVSIAKRIPLFSSPLFCFFYEYNLFISFATMHAIRTKLFYLDFLFVLPFVSIYILKLLSYIFINVIIFKVELENDR